MAQAIIVESIAGRVFTLPLVSASIVRRIYHKADEVRLAISSRRSDKKRSATTCSWPLVVERFFWCLPSGNPLRKDFSQRCLDEPSVRPGRRGYDWWWLVARSASMYGLHQDLSHGAHCLLVEAMSSCRYALVIGSYCMLPC
jgi:hypothetical protein